MRWQLSFALVALPMTLFTPSALAECTKDVDCKGDRICVEGACVDPPARSSEPAPAAAVRVEDALASRHGNGDEDVPPPTQQATTPEAPAAPRMVRRSQGLFVGGIVSMGLAPVGLVVAMAGWSQQRVCEFDAAHPPPAITHPAPESAPANCARFDGLIYGGIAGSIALLGGGLAMLLVGVQKVPATTETAKIRPWVSPSTAGLSLQTTF